MGRLDKLLVEVVAHTYHQGGLYGISHLGPRTVKFQTDQRESLGLQVEADHVVE